MTAPLGWPFDHPPLAHGDVDGIAWAIAAGGPDGMRTINGYARIPWEGHPWTGCTNYDDLDVSVHGGLTYGPKPEFDMYAVATNLADLTAGTEHPFTLPSGPPMKPIPATTFTATGGWIGFDTGHAWDYWSEEELASWGVTGGAHLRMAYRTRDRWDRWWTGEQVIVEAQDLARQIAAAGKLPTDD